MSKITVEITRADVFQKGSHFLVVQLDETEYPSKLRRTQKFRTEIEFDTEYPKFLKNHFEFNKVSLGNRIVIRIGLFDTSLQSKDQDKIPSNVLFEYSELVGANDIVFTKTFIDMLRKHKWVENDYKLYHPDKDNVETGHVYVKFFMKAETLDEKFYENNSEVEECYYDPFETDNDQIRKKLKSVIILNEEKQLKLEKRTKELDEVHNKLKRLAIDKKIVEKEINDLEEENNLLKKNLERIQNYDEIHIEVDILSQSNQGTAMLEKKYAVLLSQLAIQSHQHMEKEREYQEIDSVLSKIKIIKEKITNVKSANDELKFNIKRHEDMLPLISMYQERIKNNGKIISNLRDNISEVIKKNEMELKNSKFNVISMQEINERLKNLYQERNKLEEKKMQMNLYQDLFSDKFKENSDDEDSQAYYAEAFQNFTRISGKGLDPMMNIIVKEGENTLIKSYQEKISRLSTEAKELSEKYEKFKKLEKEKKENMIILDPRIKIKKRDLIFNIEESENRERTLLDELDSSQAFYNQSLSKMKKRIENIDLAITKELYDKKNSYRGRANDKYKYQPRNGNTYGDGYYQ